MMARGGGRWMKGKYTPKNPEKYVGKTDPTYRSSWELTMMIFLDENKNILQWASEAIAIPYKNPLTGKISKYFPDFFVVYENKRGQRIVEVVEIKPANQSVVEGRMGANARATVALNMAKWAAAKAYCKQQGFTFRVITENELFSNRKPTKPKPPRPTKPPRGKK